MSTFSSFRVSRLLAALITLFLSTAVLAAELKIGFKSEVNSADPHVLNASNRNVWMHVYESLLAQDASLQPKPRLAVSWQLVDDLTWQFKLSPNVYFHDGSAFSSEDVKFSIERGLALTGPRTFRTYLKDIDSVSAPDARTVLIKTKVPSPTLPENLAIFPIVSKNIGKEANEESFATGKTAFGTGPYKFGQWVHGERITLTKNDKYWGDKEPWDKLTFQFIPKDPARASSLLAGASDVIDGVSSDLTETLKASNKVGAVVSTTSYWLIYLSLDQFRDDSPFLMDNDGKPLGKNPFKDRKVRQALNHAINREAIVKRIMKDDAVPAGQVVPAGFFGNDVELKAPVYDLAKAKALLAEAGYPKGFQLTLHCSNDRYPNDAKVCEALGQMFTQVGIKTDVQALPFAVFQTRSLTGGPNGQPEFSALVIGIGAATGEALTPLISVAHSFDKKAGAGANNRARYSNNQVDALIQQATKALNESERRRALQAATRALMEDVGIVPIHFLKASWATRKGVTLAPRADGFTFGMNAREHVKGAKKSGE